MIHAGTDLKYRMHIELAGFTPNEDYMELVIKMKSGKVAYSYKPEDMFTDGNGDIYFTMEDVKAGTYKAQLACYLPDADFPDQSQRIVDLQTLVKVGTGSCCCCDDDLCDCECECGTTEALHVTYERIWTGSTGGDAYLVDENGQPILDSDGEKIHLIPTHANGSEKVRLNMTGEEFKTLIEGRTDNNVTDTVPELIEQAATAVNPDQLDWISRQMRADLEEEAKKKFAVTTTPDGNSSYYADEVSSKQMTVKVYTTFDGQPVDCGQVGDWQHTAGTNEYTKVITASGGSGATCAAQTFTYTVPSGGYAGITVTGESEKRSISAVKPFYYGWADTNNTNNIQSVMNAKTLTRVTNNTGSGKFTQQPGDMSWFWIVVPEGRTASVTQAGGTNIMKSAATATPESPYGQGIYLPCKVYVSEQYFERGKEIDIDWKVS